jgi:hypothetical protein
VLPYGLKLTYHLEEETGTKIFWGMLLFEHQYDVVNVKLKHDISIFYLFLAQNLSLGISPVFHILLHALYFDRSFGSIF